MADSWIRLSWDLFSAQNRVDQNEDPTPGYTLLHLGCGREFHLGKQVLQAQVQLINLTNTRYLNNMSRYRILNLPEQGRNVQVSLGLLF